MKYILGAVIALFLFTLLLLLTVNNQVIITFNYLLAQRLFNLSTLLICFFSMGLLLSGLLFMPIYLRLRWRLHNSKKQLAALEQTKSS